MSQPTAEERARELVEFGPCDCQPYYPGRHREGCRASGIGRITRELLIEQFRAAEAAAREERDLEWCRMLEITPAHPNVNTPEWAARELDMLEKMDPECAAAISRARAAARAEERESLISWLDAVMRASDGKQKKLVAEIAAAIRARGEWE